MRHAVLGAGGIGGLIAAALARSGAEVALLLRPESLAAYHGRWRVESVVLGDFEVDVPASAALDSGVDALWVATKATQLERALPLAPPEVVGEGLLVPLLNGVDHVGRLRRRYRRVVAAAIRVESERPRPGLIRQKSPFLRVDVAGAEPVQAALREAGFDCHARTDEPTLLWEKLVYLAPIALATSAFDAPLGDVRETAVFVGCRTEASEPHALQGQQSSLIRFGACIQRHRLTCRVRCRRISPPGVNRSSTRSLDRSCGWDASTAFRRRRLRTWSTESWPNCLRPADLRLGQRAGMTP